MSDIQDQINESIDDLQHLVSAEAVNARPCPEAARAIETLERCYTVLGHLPPIIDGSPAYPGRVVYVRFANGTVVMGEVRIDKYSNGLSVAVYQEHFRNGNGANTWHDLKEAYPTRAAAEAKAAHPKEPTNAD